MPFLAVRSRIWRRVLRLAGLVALSWCVFVITHEGGHIVAGTVCGGSLIDAELRPWRLPHSFFEPDPYPLATLWGGPLLGAVLPVGLALLLRQRWCWFVAWLCVLANGAYIATGWLAGDRELDTVKLLANGAGPAWVAAYCLVTLVPGYAGFRRAWLVEWDEEGIRKSSPDGNPPTVGETP